MNKASLVHNCYRAILAQVNQLDSIYEPKNRLKELYEELTELAFYIMENDSKRVYRGIEQIKATIDELEQYPIHSYEQVRIITTELITHLDFLLLEYQNNAHS